MSEDKIRAALAAVYTAGKDYEHNEWRRCATCGHWSVNEEAAEFERIHTLDLAMDVIRGYLRSDGNG